MGLSPPLLWTSDCGAGIGAVLAGLNPRSQGGTVPKSKVFRAVAVLVSLFLLTAQSVTASPAAAAPYVGADIVVNGSDYTAVSALADPPTEGWWVDGTAIWSNTDQQWAEYEVDLTAGDWLVGIDATNEGSLGDDPTWYPQFELSVAPSGSTLAVPASATEIQHGAVTLNVPSDGP